MKRNLLTLFFVLLIPCAVLAQEAYAIYENHTLTFYYDDMKDLRNGTVYALNSGKSEPGWRTNIDVITKVVFAPYFSNARPTSTYDWFGGATGLAEIEGIQYLNTESVTTMENMFYNCSKLQTIDLGGFNTAKVTSMSSMFRGCSGLTSLDLSSFDTSIVTSMHHMFQGCSGLTSLDLSSFDTSSVTSMRYMFYDCSSLTSLDLSSFDTSSVTNMDYMFSGCSGLTTIYCGNDWNTDKVTYSFRMFYNCINLVGGAGTVYNSNYIDKTYAHVDGGPDNPGYLTLKGSSQGGETPVDAEAYVVYNDGTLTFYYDNLKSSRSGTKYGLNEGSQWPDWYQENDITNVVIDSSFKDARPTSTSYWFCQCNVTSLDLSNLNTSSVTNMSRMFDHCENLISLDLSGFDTSNVTDMNYMFYACTNLASLDLSSFNTSNVKLMYRMFSYCEKLTSLDLSNFNIDKVLDMYDIFKGCRGLISLNLSSFDTSSIEDMSHMFESCSSLTSLDLSNFNTAKVRNMSSMFSYCRNLTSIYVCNEWSTNKVNQSSYMFSGCDNLIGGAGTVFDSSHVNATYAHVDGGVDNPGYLTLKDSSQGGETPVDAEAYVVYNDGTLTFYYDNLKSSRSGTKYELNNSYYDPGWYTDHRRDITKAVFDATFAEARPTSTYRWFAVSYNETSVLTSIEGIEYLNTSEVTTMRCMFYGCSGLTSLDLRSFDTSSVTDMSGMFYNCSGLTSLDLSNFDTSSVTSMYQMFYGCSGLTSLDLRNFDTSSVKNMGNMFYGCSGLTSLDLSNFDTSSVTNMYDMFYGCSGLTSLDLSSFDTSNVTDMCGMFYNCSGLTSLDLSSFNTSSVTDMQGMFGGCSGLTTLGLSSFNTSSVTDMYDMFYECSGLTSLDLSSFDTSNVTDMSGMFYNCSGLTSLDLSTLNTGSVTEMQGMFGGCSGLTTIYCGNDWNTDKVTSSVQMFYNCINLVGGAGTVYNSSHTNIAYAHVDGGPDNPGYLTLKGSDAPVYALGDVNRDGSVDIGDIVMTINVMTGSETDADIMAAADVNSDDCVDIGDIVAIIDIMTSSPAAARAQRAPAATDADDYIEAAATGNGIVVGLNNQHAFTAFQMVLTLPAGCTLNEVFIDSKRGSRHIAEVKSLANGSYLVMGYSLNNKLLKGNEGLLFTITTAGVQPTGAVISDVLFATAEGGTYRLAGIEVGTAGTTGISTVNGRTETADPVYDLNGRRRVTTAKDALLPGLYIINGKKTVIK